MDIITKYFPDLSEKQKKRLDSLLELYKFWNSQINVVSRKDIEALYEKHVLHSLAIAKYTTFKKGQSVLDVGTGGGFPGIPLAIMFPETEFVLIDSIGKKIKVVQEVAFALGLKNVIPIHTRVQDIKTKHDVIVSRAVTAFPEFVEMAYPKLRVSSNMPKNGIIYLKGGDFDEELKGLNKVEITAMSDYFEESFFETKKIIYLPR